MPYKSEAQRRFFNSPRAKEAGIKQETVDEFNKASEGKKLPDRIHPKKYKSTSDLRVRFSELAKKKT